MRRLALAGVVVALLATACGNDDTEAAAPADPAADLALLQQVALTVDDFDESGWSQGEPQPEDDLTGIPACAELERLQEAEVAELRLSFENLETVEVIASVVTTYPDEETAQALVDAVRGDGLSGCMAASPESAGVDAEPMSVADLGDDAAGIRVTTEGGGVGDVTVVRVGRAAAAFTTGGLTAPPNSSSQVELVVSRLEDAF